MKWFYEEVELFLVYIRCGVLVYNLDKDENNWFVYINIGMLEVFFVLFVIGVVEYFIFFFGWIFLGVMLIGVV